MACIYVSLSLVFPGNIVGSNCGSNGQREGSDNLSGSELKCVKWMTFEIDSITITFCISICKIVGILIMKI